jgi:outer membrane protein OmpA-like peptidoglycan-associated protein
MRKFTPLVILMILCFPICGRCQSSWNSVLIVYFKSGKYILDLNEENKLIIALNNGDSSLEIQEISGFTDSVGTVWSNMLLAKKRSEYVIDFLKQHALLNKNYKINIYGEQKPASDSDLSLNRRVEIVYRSTNKNIVSPDTLNFKIVRKIELENIYFKPDAAVLEPSSMPYLDELANILKQDTNNIFEIKGHVNWNPRPSAIPDSGYLIKMNELSAARAKLVYEILIDRGISSARMFWKGMGNTEMIYPNAGTEEQKRKNMRVEVLVLKKPD